MSHVRLAAVLTVLCAGSAVIAAQTALTQLGLTETAARNFLLDEISAPAGGRRSDIVVAGTRAFLKLPPLARAPAATGLFAWARAYVNSPAFNASYAKLRGDRNSESTSPALTVEQELRRQLDELLAEAKRLRQIAATASAADRAGILDMANEAEKYATDPEFIKLRHESVVAERAARDGNDAAATARAEEQAPADPKQLFARRLREFLAATTDVDFSTRTISLTGGPDGIEFIDPAVRTKHWMWHEAVIVGPEATAAARAAAQAWLKEIER